MFRLTSLLLFILLLHFTSFAQTAHVNRYQNFKVSVYCRAYEVQKMKDTTGYLKPLWDELSRQLKVDKVYIETHRDLIIVDQPTLDIAKKFLPTAVFKLPAASPLPLASPTAFKPFATTILLTVKRFSRLPN